MAIWIYNVKANGEKWAISKAGGILHQVLSKDQRYRRTASEKILQSQQEPDSPCAEKTANEGE